MTADSIDVRHARIAWRCRRGMRELDLLLEKFLSSGLESLEDDDLDCLEDLLGRPDQDILAWLTSVSEPDDADIRRIVKVLRNRIRFRSNTDE